MKEIAKILLPHLKSMSAYDVDKIASEILALFNTEEIREKIAEWLYNHEQLKYQTKTLSWNELPEIAKQVWLNNAFQILSLIFDQKQEVCPELKEG